MNRRSFFSGVARAVAIIALAPQIAFRTRFEFPEALDYKSNAMGIYAQLQSCEKYFDEVSPVTLSGIFDQAHALHRLNSQQAERDKRNREMLRAIFS